MKKIFLLATFIFLILCIFLPKFIIKVKLDCKSQYGNCPPSIVEEINTLNGKRMYDAQRILTNNLKSNFMISDFTVQFKLPNILSVDLIVKKPMFVLKNRLTGVSAFVDKDGYVLNLSNEARIPMVITDENLPQVKEKVSEKDLLALELIDGVFKMYQTGTGIIEGNTLLVDLPGSIRVIFPLVDSDRDLLLGSLRLIYSNIQGNEKGVSYSQIDLRYKNPILK